MLTILVLLFNELLVPTASVTVHRVHTQDTGYIVKDLKQVIITCRLNDIVIIDVPVIEGRDTTYLLHRPDGDITTLNISIPSHSVHVYDTENIQGQTRNNYEKVQFVLHPVEINEERKYETFNIYLNNSYSYKDTFERKKSKMKANEFMLGPLTVGDHGSWLLSCVYSEGGKTFEVNQPIVIEITESIPANQAFAVLKPGDTFMPQFAYPIESLSTCELAYPQSDADRQYTRNPQAMDFCGFVVDKVTVNDTGLWIIIGVGPIVYVSEMVLEVRDT